MFWTKEELELLQSLASELQQGFDPLPETSWPAMTDSEQQALQQAAQRMQDNFPYQHPFYLGQMLKPPHRVARIAYAMAMSLNPNNHALDGGRASSEMERECVSKLASMFGWENALGHLCSGGTVANFEALWVAREVTGGRAIAASSQAHYTHERLSGVLQVPFVSVPVNDRGQLDVNALRELLESELTPSIGTVVATVGTTGLGAIDPVREILSLCSEFDLRVHVDAAYGGYFGLTSTISESARRSFEAIEHADSIVIDPHKHGLQPYGCGCVLFGDPRVAEIYQHDSPYTYFTGGKGHLGEISLECSRAGAAAVALWTTMQALPLEPGGEFASGLEKSLEAARQLAEWVRHSNHFQLIVEPELDLVVWMPKGETVSEVSAKSRAFFEAAAERDIHLALISLSRPLLEHHGSDLAWDANEVVCLRSCLMKPEHLDWLAEILRRLEEISEAVLNRSTSSRTSRAR